MRFGLAGGLVWLWALSVLATPAAAKSKEVERLERATEVLQEIMAAPDGGIPRDLLDRAECVGIIPGVKKLAFGFGGRYGKGVFVCRQNRLAGRWGPPAMYMLGGGSIGFQIGGTSTDFILLIMNPKGAEYLLRSKFTLGADLSAAAGPKGRTAAAATDALMHAEILTYSRARGLFAGASLEGAVVRQDKTANKKIYGHEINVKQVLLQGQGAIPAPAQPLINTLNKYSPKNISAKRAP
ncbi:MAG: lipid-binding SYLF domain-containing protein [Terriglobia bacterium]